MMHRHTYYVCPMLPIPKYNTKDQTFILPDQEKISSVVQSFLICTF